MPRIDDNLLVNPSMVEVPNRPLKGWTVETSKSSYGAQEEMQLGGCCWHNATIAGEQLIMTHRTWFKREQARHHLCQHGCRSRMCLAHLLVGGVSDVKAGVSPALSHARIHTDILLSGLHNDRWSTSERLACLHLFLNPHLPSPSLSALLNYLEVERMSTTCTSSF